MKKIAGAILFFSFVSVFISCNWRIPETISVKSNADYNFSLGNFNHDLDSQMNLQAMLGNVESENADIQVYDYFPGKTEANVQHFLVNVKVYEMDFAQQIPALATAIPLLPDDATFDLSSLPVPVAYGPEIKGLNLNPSSMLDGLKNAIGYDFTDKIEFDSVPLYLYCKVTDGLSAKATLKMYYGSSSDPIVIRPLTEKVILNNSTIANRPIPQFAKEGDTVISNLSNSLYITSVNVADIINNNHPSIQDDDQLCIMYNISDVTGIFNKAALENGLKIEIYAALDIPLKFKTKADLMLDLAAMNNSSSASSDGSSASFSVPTLTEEVKKLFDVIDSMSVKYTAYRLPIYSTSGIFLGVDLLGNGQYTYADLSVADENNPKPDDQKVITFPAQTIFALKNQTSINPKIKAKIADETVFSIPRSKNIKMNIELNIKTDGEYQIK